jgi:hypothetical protein
MRIPVFISLPTDARAARPTSPFAGVRRVLSGLGAFLRAWRDEHATLRLMAALDEATLRDIGLEQFHVAEAMQERRRKALEELVGRPRRS